MQSFRSCNSALPLITGIRTTHRTRFRACNAEIPDDTSESVTGRRSTIQSSRLEIVRSLWSTLSARDFRFRYLLLWDEIV